MCKSKDMGGQRCPGHASKDLSKKREALAQVQAAFAQGQVTEAKVNDAKQRYWKSLVEWASTSNGSVSLREQMAAHADQASPQVTALRRAIDAGALLAQKNREVENAWRAERDQGPLATPVPLTFAQEAEQAAEHARRVAEEQRAAADPLGLRAAAAAAPVVTLPVQRPVLPIQPPAAPAAQAAVAVVPASMPDAPAPTLAPAATAAGVAGGLLPTQRPDTAAQAAQALQALAAREAELVAERQAREVAERAAEKARAAAELQSRRAADRVAQVRQQAAAQVQQVRTEQRDQQAQVRAAAQARNNEVRRLKAETAKEAKAYGKWAREVGAAQMTAPPETWAGPARWNGAAGASMRENWDALKAGRQAYGSQFDALVERNASRYTPAEVLEVCQRLHAQGQTVMAGGDRPRGWYESYRHIGAETLQQARRAAIRSELGPREAAVLSKRYVFANADGVLKRALMENPKAPRQRVSTATTRVFGLVTRAEESWRGVMARFGARPLAA